MAIRSKDRPRVSVGLPVYNGARYLDLALDSLRSQEFDDFDLIISDNASTDETATICQDHASCDRRIRYIRQPENRGAVWNFNHVFQLSTGTYFLWAAHDDLWASKFLSRCVAELDSQPACGVCVTGIHFIDEVGDELPEGPWRHNEKPTGATRWARISVLARTPGWFTVYGLMRRSVLERTRLFQPVCGSDVVLTLEVCLLGDVAGVDEKLFYYRVMPKPVQQIADSLVAPGSMRASWCDFAIEMIGAIGGVRLRATERAVLSGRLLAQLCIQNDLMRTVIRRDVFPSAFAAVRQGRIRHALAVIGLGAVVYPASVPNVLRRHGTNLWRRIGVRKNHHEG